MTDILDEEYAFSGPLKEEESILWEAELIPDVKGIRHPDFSPARYAMGWSIYLLLMVLVVGFMNKHNYLWALAVCIPCLAFMIYSTRLESYWYNRRQKTKNRRYLLTEHFIILFTGRKWMGVPISAIVDIAFTQNIEGIGSIILVLKKKPKRKTRDLINGALWDLPHLQVLPDVARQHRELKGHLDELQKSGDEEN